MKKYSLEGLRRRCESDWAVAVPEMMQYARQRIKAKYPTLTEEDVQDITSKAIEQLYEEIDTLELENEQNLWGVLAVIALRGAASWVRRATAQRRDFRRQIQQESSSETAEVITIEDPVDYAQLVETAEIGYLLKEGLKELNSSERALLYYWFYMKFTSSEIAELLNIRESNVTRDRNRAVAKLCKVLKRKGIWKVLKEAYEQ